MNARRLCAVLLAVAVMVIAAPALFAQDEGAAPVVRDKTLWDLILAGGWVGHCIIITNVGLVAIIIELFVNLKREKLAPPEIVVELETLLEEEQFEEAVALCEGSRNYISAVVGAAIARIGDGPEAMDDAMANACEEENMKLNQKVAWLSLLGNLGPLLGLFGTVTGMVGAFQVIEQTKNPSPADLAKGIYEALITTVEGLIVGIPATCFFFFFRNRASRLSFELAGIADELVSKFKPLAEGGKQGK